MSRREQPDDDQLVAHAVAGDQAALDTLLRTHMDRVYAVCLRMVGDHHDAMDATQHALLAVSRGLPRFDGRSAFTTWIHRIAVNAALDELRRRKRRPAPVETLPETRRADGTAAVDARLDVDAALATLPEEFRVAVVLRDLVGLDYQEIAAVLDVPIGTVRSRISRGRSALSAGFGEPAPGPGTSK